MKEKHSRLEKIRSVGGLSPHLPKGGVKEIERILSRNHTSVSLILSGKWWDEDLIRVALEMIEADAKAKLAVVADLRASLTLETTHQEDAEDGKPLAE